MANNVLMPYTANGQTPAVAVIDIAANTARVTAGGGVIYPKTVIVQGSVVYMAVGDTLKSLGLDTDTWTTHGQTGDSILYVGCVAPDGVLFFGTFGEGRLCSYDPATDTFIDHGRMDEGGPAYQYGYSIAADNDYVYVGLGQSPWYLSIYNRSTGAKVLHYKGELGGTSHVQVGVDGSLWYYGHQLINGEPVDGTPPDFVAWYKRNTGVNIDSTTWDTECGVEVNTDDAIPVNGTSAMLRWRATGAETWREQVVSGLPKAPAIVRLVVPYDNTRLLCVPDGYGPLCLYDTTDDSVEVLGFTARSLYDALRLGGDWYLSGYPATTMRWNPAAAWTLTKSSTDRTTTNPRDVMDVSKYHRYNADYDGVLYVAVHHERDSIGGEIGWYDPTTDDTGSLRTGLETYDPLGFVVVGNMLVYAAENLEGGDGRLVLFDPSTKTITATQAPLADLDHTSPGLPVAVSSTDVVCLAGATAYRWNTSTNSQVWRVTLDDVAMADILAPRRRAEVAPDGKIYFFVGPDIYRLDPVDGALTWVCDGETQGCIMWHGGVGYIYGTTTLRKLTGV